MKRRYLPLVSMLLLSLLLCAAACGDPNLASSDTAVGTESDRLAANIPTAGQPSETLTASQETTAENMTEAITTPQTQPEDTEIDRPMTPNASKVMLSTHDGRILGFSADSKPQIQDVITSYGDFYMLYGAVEGIDKTFFETHVFRLAHTAQSSSSTRYTVESVTAADGTVKVEIIEQHAAMATRDLRVHYVFVAVEKACADTPLDVRVAGVQLAS